MTAGCQRLFAHKCAKRLASPKKSKRIHPRGPILTRLTLTDGTEVPLTLKRSARARRFSLRVSRLDGGVTLTLPKRASEREGLDFARGQVAWLDQVLAEMVPPSVVAHGASLPFEGRAHVITPAPVRAARIEADQILVPGNPSRLGTSLEAFLKLAARQRLQAASERYAAELGAQFSKISLRDTRSRWGSCSHSGALSYNWRLVMAPPEVLDYVAAHEVAHLREMNHSAAFWALVAALRPSYRAERAWLKREGGALHAIRFHP